MSDPTNPPPGNPYGDPPPSNPYGSPPDPPANPYGEAPQPPPAYGQQPYGQQPYGQQPHGAPAYGGADPDKRPGTVTAASIITMIFSAISLLAFGILAIAVQGSEGLVDEINREFEGQPGFEDFSADEVINYLTIALVILAIWSLSALVLAVLAMRRQNWARILVVISAAMSGLLSLLFILTGVSAIPLIAAIATVVLYFVGGANQWYARPGQQPQHPAGPAQQPWG